MRLNCYLDIKMNSKVRSHPSAQQRKRCKHIRSHCLQGSRYGVPPLAQTVGHSELACPEKSALWTTLLCPCRLQRLLRGSRKVNRKCTEPLKALRRRVWAPPAVFPCLTCVRRLHVLLQARFALGGFPRPRGPRTLVGSCCCCQQMVGYRRFGMMQMVGYRTVMTLAHVALPAG